ncbi:MAG TPA: sugar ABC transporter ATP-binding protein [Fimbriimonas sp.]
MPPLIELRNIVKRYPGVVALGGVSLEVSPGEVVALIGENGAGKSTLMKVLGGVILPDEGEVLVDGEHAAIDSVRTSESLGIGFIHQELSSLDNLDVAGNVFLGREPSRFGLMDRRRMNEDARKVLASLGLEIAPDTPLRSLSLAQRQMVEIAKALSLDARVLIMDEPTSSLTLSETERLLQVVRELRDQGVAVIYISHRLGEVHQVADRVVALKDGQNAGGLAKDEISHERMVRLMVGRDLDKAAVPAARSIQDDRLSVQGLRTSRYPGKEVSFAVRAGEIFCLAGLVGAGRSEVVQAVFGTDSRAGGSVLVDGAPVPEGSPSGAIGAGIGLVPEDRRGLGLIVEWPIRENLTLPTLGEYAGAGLVKAGPEREAAERQSKAIGVKAPSTEVRAANLSGGNQQKVVLGKWLLANPKVLILDEPTRGVDVGAKAEIYELMRNLTDQGVAVLMVSSDMEEVLGVSDRVGVMHEGTLTGILTRDECTEESIMRLAVGRIEAQ